MYIFLFVKKYFQTLEIFLGFHENNQKLIYFLKNANLICVPHTYLVNKRFD